MQESNEMRILVALGAIVFGPRLRVFLLDCDRRCYGLSLPVSDGHAL